MTKIEKYSPILPVLIAYGALLGYGLFNCLPLAYVTAGFGRVESVLLVVAAAVPAAYYAHRRSQRRKLLKRRYNPYIAGAPVLQDDLFFGREQLLTRVLQSIHNNSILLYGERRIQLAAPGQGPLGPLQGLVVPLRQDDDRPGLFQVGFRHVLCGSLREGLDAHG